MKHYDLVEWVLYKKKLLDKKIYEEMEEHLYKCDQCLDIFLSLIDDLEIEKTKSLVPKDFTKDVINNIKSIGEIEKRSIKKKNKIPNDFFIYYTAVASVAIILTATGFFGKLVDSVPQVSKKMNREEIVMTNSVYNLSEQITKKTSIFINEFQVNKNKEDK